MRLKTQSGKPSCSHSSEWGASSCLAKLSIDSRSASCSSVRQKCLLGAPKSGLISVASSCHRGTSGLGALDRRCCAKLQDSPAKVNSRTSYLPSMRPNVPDSETLLYDVERRRRDRHAEPAGHPQRALERAARRADRGLRVGPRRRRRALRRAHLLARQGLLVGRQPGRLRRRRADRPPPLRHRAVPAALPADRRARQAHDLRRQRARARGRARHRARLRPDHRQGGAPPSGRPRSTWARSRS